MSGHQESERARSLWRFAGALYAQPGVDEACLRLQDEAGLDVCELLWLCWLERSGRAPGMLEELEQVRAWQRHYTWALRRLRRELKPVCATLPRLAALRETIKRAELEAEHETLRRLAELAQRDQPAGDADFERWHGNLSSSHAVLVARTRRAGALVPLE